jgi:surface antigen
MDNADRAAYDRASQRAMESGRAQSWKNTDSGNHGTITPKPSYTNSEGQPCRKYTQTIYINGEKHRGYGTACRQADGTWHIQ